LLEGTVDNRFRVGLIKKGPSGPPINTSRNSLHVYYFKIRMGSSNQYVEGTLLSQQTPQSLVRKVKPLYIANHARYGQRTLGLQAYGSTRSLQSLVRTENATSFQISNMSHAPNLHKVSSEDLVPQCTTEVKNCRTQAV
jgi:hypothetical protein